jgi:membrane-bound serine protease (ClpP class)
MPTWLSIISLFVVGFVFLFIEVVIIPGFGLAGILGAVALVAACYTAFTSLSPIIGLLVCAASIAVVFFIFKILPKTKIWKKTSLAHFQGKNQGYQVAAEGLKELVGKQGTSLTMLRPSGTALIESKRYDVVSDCEFIEKDKKIKVIEVEGNRIVVSEIEENS